VPVYNVLTPVVALVQADNEDQAIAAHAIALRAAGFEPYEDGESGPDAFESEELPPGSWPDFGPDGQPLTAPTPTIDESTSRLYRRRSQ
jgi:hypothetical protein